MCVCLRLGTYIKTKKNCFSVCVCLCLCGVMISKIEISAFSSMIIVTLPFPALPVVCTSEDGDTRKHASGHDILSSAIMSSALKCEGSAPLSDKMMQERKQGILLELNQTVSGLWKCYLENEGGCTEKFEEDTIAQCYLAYCAGFRQYMRCYPGSPDLRIMDLEDVDINSAVHLQSVAHLNARAKMFGDTGESVGPRVGYAGLLKEYVQSLYAESQYCSTE